MPLIKDGELSEDPWTAVADDMPLPASGAVIVSLARWQTERDELVKREDPVGVRLHSDEAASEIAADLGHLSLVALEFPAFRDGRAFSAARQLRESHGFQGEVRAVGTVLRDQYLFLHRCGFDALEVTEARALDDWRAAIAEFDVWYQATGDGRPRVADLRRRRESA